MVESCRLSMHVKLYMQEVDELGLRQCAETVCTRLMPAKQPKRSNGVVAGLQYEAPARTFMGSVVASQEGRPTFTTKQVSESLCDEE